MSQGHTPGPWKAYPEQVDEEYFGSFIPVRDGSEYPIVLVRNDDHPEAGHANARLIAAAPDLLATCKKIENDLRFKVKIKESCGQYLTANSFRCVADRLASAIARAEGRADG